MRVRLQPADRGGCGLYRLIWPSDVLRDMGATITVESHMPAGRYRDCNGITTLLSVECDADVIVLQRPMHRLNVEAIPVLQAQGTAVVVEIDDDFHSLPKGHPAKAGTSAAANPDINRGWLRRACEAADLVTCSTPALAERYAPHGRAIILPNCVPARYLDIRREPHDGPAVVGWTGSTVTHVDDLRVCGTGVADALFDSGARFHTIGTGVGVREQLQLPEITAEGWVEIDDYPARYAQLDVAIVPLQPNRFNEAKSWLKGMEAAALGVPFVASPTGPYRQLIEFGAGSLAETPTDWAREVRRLARSPLMRDDRAAIGRFVASQFTIEQHAWRWLEAWEQAIRNHTAAGAAA